MDKEEYKRQNEERDKKKNAQSFRQRWFGWWKTPSDRFAALIALFTAVLALVAYCQLGAMRSTDEAIHTQLEIMQGQLNEMQIAKRPSVSFHEVEFQTAPDSNAEKVTFYGYPQWTNGGESPTSRLTFGVFCHPEGVGSFDYRKNGVTPRVLGPKQTNGGGRCEITITKIPPVDGIVGWMQIGGKARYFNSPLDKEVRITEFCQIFPVLRSASVGGYSIRAGLDGVKLCPEHNCTDSECPAEDRN
jgi:hypothetical protein